MKHLIKSFDEKVTAAIVSLPQSWHGVFMGITALGDPIITIGIGVVVALVGWFGANMRLVLSGAMIWITLATGSLLKLAFGRERPLTEYSANLRVDTFSFPSGHSSGAMIAYGLLAYIAIKLLPGPWGVIVAMFCGFLIALIGISRVYLGAHFPSDVVAGWVLGIVALLIIIFVIRPL